MASSIVAQDTLRFCWNAVSSSQISKIDNLHLYIFVATLVCTSSLCTIILALRCQTVDQLIYCRILPWFVYLCRSFNLNMINDPMIGSCHVFDLFLRIRFYFVCTSALILFCFSIGQSFIAMWLLNIWPLLFRVPHDHIPKVDVLCICINGCQILRIRRPDLLVQ